NDEIQHQLEFYLEEMILPGKKFTVENRWSGIMACSENHSPGIEKISDRIIAGICYNENGVSIGSKLADDLSRILIH
ncbi:MAG: FAD-binding oxidoreductase, partial [Bacteroidia bacterium]